MEENKVDTATNNVIHPLQRPLLLIAVSIMFSGILVAGSIVATRVFSMPSALQNGVAVQKSNDTPLNNDSESDTSIAKDGSINLSFGDDPVLGDTSKAKIAIVEFSDYECPFCQKFHNETFDVLKKEYVDTGKAVIVFKDFPLSFHEPMASKEASAANCVQKIAGDKAYFSYSASLYKNTAANGKGMPDSKMADLAVSTGVERNAFVKCVADNNFEEEIANDLATGESVGVSGTPAFIIGNLDKENALVNGTKLIGAQPIDAFRKALDAQLK